MGDEQCTLPYPLLFADQSRTWQGGGVAYVATDLPGTCRARRWLLTLGQFSDVVAQEGGRLPEHDLDLETVLGAGRMIVGSGWYDLVVLAGWVEQVPVLTLTTSRPAATLRRNPPSDAYANTLIRGLVESHGLSTASAGSYVLQAAGNDP